jgi:hypothetical protein
MYAERQINRIIIFAIITIFFLDYLSVNLGLIPRIVTWIPDLIAVALSVFVLLLFALFKQINLKKKYFVFFALYIGHLLIGVIANTVPPGAVFSGFRTYFRYFPFFILPSLMVVKEQSLHKHFRLLFFLGFIQVPISIYQRFFKYEDVLTGDVVTGTLITAPFLVIFQIAIICFLTTLYVKGKMSFKFCILLNLILFIPCTINETKAVIILLPAAILSINIFANNYSSKIKRIIAIPLIFALLVAIFIPIYDYFAIRNWGYGLMDFMAKRNLVQNYLYKEASGEDEEEKIGRVDSILFALEHISEDPFKFTFGLGMGNVSPSFSINFSGEYSHYNYLGVGMTTYTILLWETGVGGVLIFILFFIFNLSDAIILRKSDDLNGNIALAWIGILTMLFISMIYIDLLHHNIGFLLSYISGYIAAQNYRFIEDENL